MRRQDGLTPRNKSIGNPAVVSFALHVSAKPFPAAWAPPDHPWGGDDTALEVNGGGPARCLGVRGSPCGSDAALLFELVDRMASVMRESKSGDRSKGTRRS